MNGGVQTKRSGAMAACRGLLVVVGLAVGCGALAAQEDRPRVGLVLSGGGARGFAHLGVLEVLHEERIPIDVIAGTSMGAVVGGIYATGLPYPELERLFRQEDWATIFEDEPARRELPMWRKQFSRMQLMGFEVGIGSTGVKLPPSIVNGAKLSTALSTHVLRARDVESFDDLPIPFRAIATDVEDGSMVVLDSGSLAAAIRASMAVPGAFTPGVIDGRRLVDGGLVRNIPVDVARAMGVDVLIVSDVATSLDEAPDATDALSLASRLVTVVTWGPSRDQLATLESTDFYLRPELTTVSSADFTTLDEAFAAGLASAEGQRAQLRSLSISEVDYQALVQDRVDALAEVEEFVPAGIRVVATETSLRPEVVEDLMRVEVGRPLTLPELRRALTRAQGYGGFQGIDFGIVDEPGGEVLELHPRDKPWGPVVARAGLSLVDRQRGRGAWSLRGVVDWSRLSSKGGEAIAEIELGTRHGLAVLGYLPLTVSGRFFARGSAQMGREEVFPEFVGLALGLDLARRDAFAGLGVRLGWWGEVVAGMRIGHSELILPEETPEVEEELTWAERSVEVVLDADILDRVVFPSRGAALRVSYVKAGTALGGSDAFQHVYAEARSAVSWGHQTLELSGLLSSGFGSTLPFYRSVPLGGFDRLTGVDRDAIRGSYAGLGKLVWSYRLGAPAAASGGGVRLGFSVEGGQGWYDPIALDDALRDLLWGGSIWAGMNTPIGALRVAYADLGGRSPGWVVQLGAGR